jgi:hypothetical protein
MFHVRYPATMLSSLHAVHAAPGSHPTSYPLGVEYCISGMKWPQRETAHSALCSVNVTNPWADSSSLPYILELWCLSIETD